VALAGVYSSPGGNAVATIYRARPLDPKAEVAHDHESSEHAWVARSAVPAWLSRMAFPSMAAALDDWAQERIGPPRLR